MGRLQTSAVVLLACWPLAAAALLPDDEASGGGVDPAALPCGAEEQASWQKIQSRVQEQVLKLVSRMPFVLFRHDLDTLDWIQAELKTLKLTDDDISYGEVPQTWTECALGLLAVRVLFVLMRVTPTQTPYAAAQVLQAIIAVPWVEAMLSGWPLFTALATLARWASPYADMQVAQFSGAQAKEAAQAARDFPSSGCDEAEVGAAPVARRMLSRLWRSQDPALTADAEARSPEGVSEAVLGMPEGGGEGGAVWGGHAGGCRWTEHADRYLGGLVEGSEVHSELLPAMSACNANSACAGLTIVQEGAALSIELRRGEPLLQASPAGEVSVARWCLAQLEVEGLAADAPPCPGGTAVGYLATAMRRLDSGSMGDFSPELIVQAQVLVSDWAVGVDAPLAQAELWATEWPIWSLLGRLQSRAEFLRSRASGGGSSTARQAPWTQSLQRALGFNDDSFRLATDELAKLARPNDPTGVPQGLRERVHCSSGPQCAGELYARLHVLLHGSGALPLRDQIFMSPEDNLAALFMEKSRSLVDGVDYDWGGMVMEEVERRRQTGEKRRSEELDRLMPANHPLQVDRRQLANFILNVHDMVSAKQPLQRCLEWDQPFLLVRAFQGVCRWTDVFSYSEPSPNDPLMGMPGRHEYPHGTRHYWGDLEHPEGPGIEPDTFDLIVCPFVFEHVSKPFVAMENLAKMLKPGGHIIWSAPFIQQYHGSPNDFFRYTPNGAKALATSAGLEVPKIYAPGDLALAAGVLTGMLLPYWNETLALKEHDPEPGEDSPRHPLNVFAVFKRPEVKEDEKK